MRPNYDSILAEIANVTKCLGEAEYDESKPLTVLDIKAAHALLDMYAISLYERAEKASVPPIDFNTWYMIASQKNETHAWLLCSLFGIVMIDPRHNALRKFLTLPSTDKSYPHNVTVHRQTGDGESKEYNMDEYMDVYGYMLDCWRDSL